MMRWLWNRPKEELSEELESHVRMAVTDRVARGQSPHEARAEAIQELGNLVLIRDVTRAGMGWFWLETLLRDLCYALRQLRRAPGFTATVLLTIAFGIGANLAVFQLLYSVILARLPLPHPEEVVSVHAAQTPFDGGWMVSYAAFRRLEASSGASVPLAARTALEEAVLEQSGYDSRNAMYELVSDDFFGVLGVSAAAGRFFIREDATPGQSEWPAVLRYDFARDCFGSAENSLGKHVRLNQVSVVIIGVADSRFADVTTGYAPDFWLPLEAQSTHLGVAFDSLGPGHGIYLDRSWLDQPGIFWLSMVARIPNDRRQAAAAQWNGVFRGDREVMALATTDPAVKASRLRSSIEVVPADHGIGGIRRQSSRPLFLLMALSASIFLVGCLNLANLQLARLSARGHELGVRMALGANHWRLVRQILIEDAVVVIVGGAAAFVTGRVASRILVDWASGRGWGLSIDLHPHLPVAALGVALMLLALGVSSVLPAFYFIRTRLAGAAGSRSRVAGLSQTGLERYRANAMLAAQVSLSLVLTAMSGCFAMTLVHWETVDLGMDREHVVSVFVDMRRTGYINRHHDWTGLYRQIGERLDALSDVRATSVEMCPMPDCGWNTALYAFGRTGLSNAQLHGEEDHVGPGFFRTMGIPLLRGRDFAASDTDATQTVAILSRSYARQLFGEENPIGHRVGYEPAPNDHKFLIVGEVADAHVDGPQADAPAMVYMTINQNPFPVHAIQVRTASDPRRIIDQIRNAIREVDPDLPVTEIVPLTLEMNGRLGTQQLLARLASIYAGLTLALVGIGFYGVMSSRISRRRGEFGIRLALGATRRHIRLLIVDQTAKILVAGILPGLLLSALAINTARHLLFGSPGDHAATVGAAAIVLVLSGLLAVVLPSRRAGRADPLEALRSE